MKPNKSLSRMMAIVIASTVMAACSLDSLESGKDVIIDPVEEHMLAACGLIDSGTRPDSYEQLVFTEQDIEWFNTTTREIKFRDMHKQPYEFLEPFHQIKFYLGGNTLFEVSSFVGDWDSRTYTDLVLHYDVITDPHQGRYYLHDCYPLQFIDTDEVKANINKRAPQWETFTSYLESKGKLRK